MSLPPFLPSSVSLSLICACAASFPLEFSGNFHMKNIRLTERKMCLQCTQTHFSLNFWGFEKNTPPGLLYVPGALGESYSKLRVPKELLSCRPLASYNIRQFRGVAHVAFHLSALCWGPEAPLMPSVLEHLWNVRLILSFSGNENRLFAHHLTFQWCAKQSVWDEFIRRYMHLYGRSASMFSSFVTESKGTK